MLFLAVAVALVAGINCQSFPDATQSQCFENAAQNNSDLMANCPSEMEIENDPTVVCTDSMCLNFVDGIYRECGFTELGRREFYNFI